jgi:hypothetical protein
MNFELLPSFSPLPTAFEEPQVSRNAGRDLRYACLCLLNPDS